MGPWEKLQLGWLYYSVVNAGQAERHSPSIHPHAGPTRRRPSLSTSLIEAIVTDYTTPLSGGHAWWTTQRG